MHPDSIFVQDCCSYYGGDTQLVCGVRRHYVLHICMCMHHFTGWPELSPKLYHLSNYIINCMHVYLVLLTIYTYVCMFRGSPLVTGIYHDPHDLILTMLALCILTAGGHRPGRELHLQHSHGILLMATMHPFVLLLYISHAYIYHAWDGINRHNAL